METSDVYNLNRLPLGSPISSKTNKQSLDINLYKIECQPPFVFSFLNILQIIICQVLNLVWLPLLLTPALCTLSADPIRVYLVSATIFTSGVVTLLQSTLGIRLPTIATPSVAYTAGLLSLLGSPDWQCPSDGDLYAMGSSLRDLEVHARLREVQGAMLFAGGVQVLLGFSGIQALLMRGLKPVSVAPAVILAGLTLSSGVHSHLPPDNWIFSSTILLLMILFSLGLQRVQFPLPTFSTIGGITVKCFPIFRMFPVLWTCVAVYFYYKSNVTFQSNPPVSDSSSIRFNEALNYSNWFYFPFPFEWGAPSLSLSTALHILPALVLQSLISLTTFHATAETCGLGSPPRQAVSRGLGLEGLGIMFGAIWGQSISTQPSNAGLMNFTGIVSRSSTKSVGLMLICLSHFTFFITRLANIPIQFLSALQLSLRAGVVCSGFSLLRLINFTNRRDSFIVGFSLLLGLAIPHWVILNVEIGQSLLDSFVSQCLGSPVFIGLATGYLLDLLLPVGLDSVSLPDITSSAVGRNSGLTPTRSFGIIKPSSEMDELLNYQNHLEQLMKRHLTDYGSLQFM